MGIIRRHHRELLFGVSIDASVFDGGTIRLYTGSVETDAGDMLATGTLPTKAFENESGGDRALHGSWSMVATKNGTARGLWLSNVGGTITAWFTVGTAATDIIIDHADVQIGDIITIYTMVWTLAGDSLVVTGTVVDGSAVAVAGGTVQLINGGGTVVDTDTPNGSGVFSLTALVAGTHTVKHHPPLTHSLGPSEADYHTVNVNGGQSPVSIVVQTAIHSDDFQSYATIGDVTYGSVGSHSPTVGKFGYNPGVVDSVNVAGSVIGDYSLDATGGPAGDKALKYTWPARPAGATSYFIAMQFRINPLPTLGSKLYIRWTSKESSGFRVGGAGVTGSGCEYKFLFADFTQSGQSSGSATLELENLTTNPSASVGLRLKLIDGTTYGSPWNGSPTSEAAHGGSGDPVLTGWDGSYHTWVMEITGLGTTAQTCVIYKDGVAFLTLSSAPFYPSVTIGGGTLTIELGANINNGPDLSQARWFREIGVYKARPSLLLIAGA